MKQRTELERRIGLLIAGIQKIWTAELGTADATSSEEVMDRAHNLLQTAKGSSPLHLLGGASTRNYLGSTWINDHAEIASYVDSVDEILQ